MLPQILSSLFLRTGVFRVDITDIGRKMLDLYYEILWQKPIRYEEVEEHIQGYPRYAPATRPNKESERRAQVILEAYDFLIQMKLLLDGTTKGPVTEAMIAECKRLNQEADGNPLHWTDFLGIVRHTMKSDDPVSGWGDIEKDLIDIMRPIWVSVTSGYLCERLMAKGYTKTDSQLAIQRATEKGIMYTTDGWGLTLNKDYK